MVDRSTIPEALIIADRGYESYNSMAHIQEKGWYFLIRIKDGHGSIKSNLELPKEKLFDLKINLNITRKQSKEVKELLKDKNHYRYLPSNVNSSTLPAEVRKYLINVDASDAGAYNDTVTPGWQKEADGSEKYLKPDGTYVSNGWLQLDDKKYYMDENGVKLKDTITPDGFYVNSDGEKVSYMPGWYKDGNYWRYIQKNGYYLANSWYQDTDGKYYYFNMGAVMAVNTTTPDGYYVDENGVWDGNASTVAAAEKNLGPGVDKGWEPIDKGWKFKQEDGTYLTNAWRQDSNGKWYYLNEDGWMLKDTNTPDGYHVGADGVYDGLAITEDTAAAES